MHGSSTPPSVSTALRPLCARIPCRNCSAEHAARQCARRLNPVTCAVVSMKIGPAARATVDLRQAVAAPVEPKRHLPVPDAAQALDRRRPLRCATASNQREVFMDKNLVGAIGAIAGLATLDSA